MSDTVQIQLLTSMIQNLERNVSEINTTTKETNQQIGKLVTVSAIHEKRITDLEEFNKTKKSDNRWSFGAIVSVISLTLVIIGIILNHFITKSL